jgi:hypothetical protein
MKKAIFTLGFLIYATSPVFAAEWSYAIKNDGFLPTMAEMIRWMGTRAR